MGEMRLLSLGNRRLEWCSAPPGNWRSTWSKASSSVIGGATLIAAWPPGVGRCSSTTVIEKSFGLNPIFAFPICWRRLISFFLFPLNHEIALRPPDQDFCRWRGSKRHLRSLRQSAYQGSYDQPHADAQGRHRRLRSVCQRNSKNGYGKADLTRS